ncbi:MAG TPA: transcriptional regulator, partial [Caulobacteraceae bacterium]|nr:transcriptional regulator [Caulobacteraceae bacterium]
EGAAIMVVDAATGIPAEPMLVDRNTGRPLAEPAFRSAPGPAADEFTRRRYAARRSSHGSAP